jgi:hypothetical protein
MFENPAKAYENINSLRESPLEKDEEDFLNFLDKKGISNHFKNIDKFEEIYGNNEASEKLFKQMSESDRYNYKSFDIGNIIKEDKERVKKQQAKAAEIDQTERARLLENILFNPSIDNSAIQSAWFGDNASATPATEFDDRFNGVDAIIQWGTGEESAKLTVDCTVSETEDVLEKKKEKVLKGIKAGSLSTVKYFQSFEDPEDAGPLSHIPQVILSIKKDVLREIAGEAINGKDFDKNYIQFNILESIKEQLEDQISIIENYTDPNNLKKLDWGKAERERFLDNAGKMRTNIKKVLKELNEVIKEKEGSLSKKKQRAERKKKDNIIPFSYKVG